MARRLWRSVMTSGSRTPRRSGAPQDAAEANVAGRGVDRLALSGRRPVTQTIVRGAQMRPALGHPARDPTSRLIRSVAIRRGRRHTRIARRAAGVLGGLAAGCRVEVVGPFPDVAGHVEDAV